MPSMRGRLSGAGKPAQHAGPGDGAQLFAPGAVTNTDYMDGGVGIPADG